MFPEAIQTDNEGDAQSPQSPAIVPTSATIPSFKSTSSLTPLVCDERVITRLLETLISRSGMSIAGAAQRMGVKDASLRQYMRGRRSRPSLQWFIRLAEVCGAKVSIEFPRVK